MAAGSTSQQSAARWHLLHKERGSPLCAEERCAALGWRELMLGMPAATRVVQAIGTVKGSDS